MNKTTTMYELLGLVKDGKAPKKIMFLGNTYRYDEIDKTYRNIIGNKNIGEMHYLEFYLDDEVEILEERKTIDDLNLSLQEIEAFQEARKIFLKLNNEEDKQTFIKLLLGESTYERWLDYLKSKGE